MESFYRLLIDGAEPVDALASAQAEVRKQNGWSSPYYWAGFIIAGRVTRQHPVSDLPLIDKDCQAPALSAGRERTER
jgi:hypothetical protein